VDEGPAVSLDFEDLDVAYSGTLVLNGARASAADGLLTGIVGPNGSGKSTLIKTLFGLVPVQKGRVRIDGADVSLMKRREVARRVGYVGQEAGCSFDFTVREIVEMGRFPHEEAWRKDRSGRDAVDEALAAMRLRPLAERNIQTLSGGEKKMTFLARAIAQGVRSVVLDEPTNHLDIKRQLFILDYLKSSGKTVLLVLHDLSLAARYCDKLYLMERGRAVAHGPPQEVLTRDNVERVFGVDGSVFINENNRYGFQLL
jgi:iron complex transport system ATP-binding protein